MQDLKQRGLLEDTLVIRGGEFGYNVARDGVHVHDFQATLLHLLGIDHERFTFLAQGRRFRLTDVKGEVVRPLLA